MKESSILIYNQVKTHITKYSKARVLELLESKSSSNRLEGLFVVRRKLDLLDNEVFDLTVTIIEDPNNDCRWQSLIVLNSYKEEKKDAIWDLIEKYGCSLDSDMRAAIATIMLEHFFEDQGIKGAERKYLVELQKLVTENELMRNTLSMCWSSYLSRKFPDILKYSHY